jgi:hypothetical protein
MPGMLDYVSFFYRDRTGVHRNIVGSHEQLVHPGSLGETDIPYNPGLAIRASDALCAVAQDKLEVTVSATGYTVPSGEVPAGPLHRVRALPRLPG